MAKVRVISVFHDLETNDLRQGGDIFECSNQRADALNAKKLVEILELDKKIEPESDKSDKTFIKKK